MGDSLSYLDNLLVQCNRHYVKQSENENEENQQEPQKINLTEKEMTDVVAARDNETAMTHPSLLWDKNETVER